MEKGQVKEVVPRDENKAPGEKLEYEERVRKMAQGGRIKLISAVLVGAAQIKGDEGSRVVRGKGVVRIGRGREKV